MDGMPANAPLDYHLWYYNLEIWKRTTWAGANALKSPLDMWNYQEILFERRPSLIVEFGTCFGGATLFFATILRELGGRGRVITVDIDPSNIHPRVRQDPLIEVLTMSSTEPDVAARITLLREAFPGPLFAVLDSDHHRDHVVAELSLLRGVTRAGDYVVVEDGNINGHPVLPGWGPGPFEAMESYFENHPEDYERDLAREEKFGFSFATRGFLIRR
jgi:cephalosporin hydroxylase